mmetsp:Transcript_31266/g.88653  ORF Transcript_31266/g.88653 Transcript_31266/m.88653 type:complete len:201 (-) Transcript_31266:328-930(-)
MVLEAKDEGGGPAMEGLKAGLGGGRVLARPPGAGLAVDVSEAVDGEAPQPAGLIPTGVAGIGAEHKEETDDRCHQGVRGEWGCWQGDAHLQERLRAISVRRANGSGNSRHSRDDPLELQQDAAPENFHHVAPVAPGALVLGPPIKVIVHRHISTGRDNLLHVGLVECLEGGAGRAVQTHGQTLRGCRGGPERALRLGYGR